MTEVILRTATKRLIEIDKGELRRLVSEATGLQVPYDDLTIYFDHITDTLILEYEEPQDVS